MSGFEHYSAERHGAPLEEMRVRWRDGLLRPEGSPQSDGLDPFRHVLWTIRGRARNRAATYSYYIEYIDELISVCLEQGVPCDDIVNMQARVKLGIEPWYGEGK
jgi:hypothetical protein